MLTEHDDLTSGWRRLGLVSGGAPMNVGGDEAHGLVLLQSSLGHSRFVSVGEDGATLRGAAAAAGAMATVTALVFLGAMATCVTGKRKSGAEQRKKTKQECRGQMRYGPPPHFSTYKGITKP